MVSGDFNVNDKNHAGASMSDVEKNKNDILLQWDLDKKKKKMITYICICSLFYGNNANCENGAICQCAALIVNFHLGGLGFQHKLVNVCSKTFMLSFFVSSSSRMNCHFVTTVHFQPGNLRVATKYFLLFAA